MAVKRRVVWFADDFWDFLSREAERRHETVSAVIRGAFWENSGRQAQADQETRPKTITVETIGHVLQVPRGTEPPLGTIFTEFHPAPKPAPKVKAKRR